MNSVVIKSGNVSFGINGAFIEKVLDLRDKGIRSPVVIAGLVNIPVTYVSKVLKKNRRERWK